MAQASDKTKQDFTMLLAYRRQLMALYQDEQQRLLQPISESEYQTSELQLVQLSRLVSETDEELMGVLQIPLGPNARRGWCRNRL